MTKTLVLENQILPNCIILKFEIFLYGGALFLQVCWPNYFLSFNLIVLHLSSKLVLGHSYSTTVLLSENTFVSHYVLMLR